MVIHIADIEQLHRNVAHVSALCRGQFVCGRSCAADAMHVRAWLLLVWSDTLELFRHGSELHHVHCRTFLRRQCVAADGMQLQCRVLLCSGGRCGVRRDYRFMCPLRPRRLLHRACGTTHAVFSRVLLIQPGKRLLTLSTRAIFER